MRSDSRRGWGRRPANGSLSLGSSKPTGSDVTETDQAADAGAEFIVTPGFSLQVIEACQMHGLPIICGAFTPTEIMTVVGAGAQLVKLFPARQGGPQYVRDLLAPFPGLRMVPTGGVSPENAASYLEAGAVAVGMGGNLVTAADVSNQHFSEITRRALACVEAVGKSKS